MTRLLQTEDPAHRRVVGFVALRQNKPAFSGRRQRAAGLQPAGAENSPAHESFEAAPSFRPLPVTNRQHVGGARRSQREPFQLLTTLSRSAL